MGHGSISLPPHGTICHIHFWNRQYLYFRYPVVSSSKSGHSDELFAFQDGRHGQLLI